MEEVKIEQILMSVIAIVVIALLIRELLCWYYKINKRLDNQKEMIRLLRKIAGEPELEEKKEEE